MTRQQIKIRLADEQAWLVQLQNKHKEITHQEMLVAAHIKQLKQQLKELPK